MAHSKLYEATDPQCATMCTWVHNTSLKQVAGAQPFAIHRIKTLMIALRPTTDCCKADNTINCNYFNSKKLNKNAGWLVGRWSALLAVAVSMSIWTCEVLERGYGRSATAMQNPSTVQRVEEQQQYLEADLHHHLGPSHPNRHPYQNEYIYIYMWRRQLTPNWWFRCFLYVSDVLCGSTKSQCF